MTGAIMIVAGGTGGHVYPGLAVAEVLRRHECDLYWMGTPGGIESIVVPASGVNFCAIPVSGLRRTGAVRWLLAPVTIAFAILCALRHMIRIRPRVVLGMGGFVSGPGGIAAWLLRRALVIHEQNAIPGLTNRILSRFATRVLEAVPGSFAAAACATAVGNPVRAAIARLPAPAHRMRWSETRSVLIFGGSQGSRALNEIVPEALAASGVARLNVLHQCGASDVSATRERYASVKDAARIEVKPYIDNMADAYAQADLVIARAGAITVAEIAASGVAAILVPYPFAVDDHQTANAEYLATQGAAILLPENVLEIDSLAAVVADLLADPARLLAMAERARALSRPQAAEGVARVCLEQLHACQ